jgi:hypothetical protein
MRNKKSHNYLTKTRGKPTQNSKYKKKIELTFCQICRRFFGIDVLVFVVVGVNRMGQL